MAFSKAIEIKRRDADEHLHKIAIVGSGQATVEGLLDSGVPAFGPPRSEASGTCACTVTGKAVSDL
jgi:hypothetical protein